MISDEERRAMADSLRHDAAYENGSLSEWWGRLQYIILDEDDFPNPEKLFNSLADLIDRPTCHMDLTETIVTVYGEICIWKCSVCGQECEEINGVYEYCPHCGAEVLDGTVDSSD